MLDETLLMLDTEHGIRVATLPEALARLCDGSLIGFEGLAAHQRHAWFLFLCQTTAMALVRAEQAEVAEDATAWRALSDVAAWRERLAALTPGCADTAWSLVVDDTTRPAFLQPPINAGMDRYATLGRAPDEIDLLVTAKGHDLKPARAGRAEPRHWIFALVSLQTQQGYSGRGNFGIARMNGGFASRPMLMLTPARDLPTRFRRGVQAALAARKAELDQDRRLFREGGKRLLWLEPWDTESSLPLHELDPLFVEICRRVRLRRAPDGGIVAFGRPSEVPRVAAPKELKGDLGDAWTPVSLAEGAALTVSASGFDYRRLHSLIATQEFSEPEALKTRAGDPKTMWLHAAVLVRGQGKTEGFHERWLQVPSHMRKLVSGDTLGRLGKAMIGDADTAREALRIGLQTFLQGGPENRRDGREKHDYKDERPRVFLDTLEQRIDRVFFTHLFARLAADADAATEIAWNAELVGLTRALFDGAIGQLSPPENRRERARARAGFAFGGVLRKAGLLAPSTDPDEEAAA